MPNSAREITRGRKFEQVCRGASAIFLRDGFAGASVDDIARAAHVSKATLYTYFSDKSLMFQEVLSACAAEVFEARMDVAPVDDSPHDYLADFLADILTWQLSPESIRLHRLAIAEAHRFPDCVTNYLRLREATLVEPIRAQIDHWVLMGSLEPHDTERSSRTVASMLGGIPTHRALLGHTPDADRIRHTAEEVASLFLMVRAARPTAAE